jgi:predicted Fe-Mo cluster-binding NifX family protein
MRIALPIWNEKLSPVLDTASKLLIVDVEDRSEAGRFEIYLDGLDLSGRCLRIQGMNVNILICGAISHPFARMLMASGIDVIPDISGPAEEILSAYLQGNLFNSRFLMPGSIRRVYNKRNNNISRLMDIANKA